MRLAVSITLKQRALASAPLAVSQNRKFLRAITKRLHGTLGQIVGQFQATIQKHGVQGIFLVERVVFSPCSARCPPPLRNCPKCPILFQQRPELCCRKSNRACGDSSLQACSRANISSINPNAASDLLPVPACRPQSSLPICAVHGPSNLHG